MKALYSTDYSMSSASNIVVVRLKEEEKRISNGSLLLSLRRDSIWILRRSRNTQLTHCTMVIALLL